MRSKNCKILDVKVGTFFTAKNRSKIDPEGVPGRSLDVWVGPGGSRGMVETLFEKRMES